MFNQYINTYLKLDKKEIVEKCGSHTEKNKKKEGE